MACNLVVPICFIFSACSSDAPVYIPIEKINTLMARLFRKLLSYKKNKWYLYVFFATKMIAI